MNSEIPVARRLYCNRTLNFRSIKAIGYDMDYTLIHYHVEEWELRAYEYLKQQLIREGWPIHSLKFDPKQVCRGLVIDTERGNLVKPNRFGFVKHATHGTKVLDFESQRQIYSRTIVDLSEPRWLFLNTLFSLSEGCMYAQLVDLLDQRAIPEVLGYADLYNRVRRVLEAAHMEGRLKAEIIADPERFVILDPETALTLLDQKHAGKKLLLITNSEWFYTEEMMTYAFDRFLPKGTTWKDLFDLIVVGARKPHFFTAPSPFFEVVTAEGLLKAVPGKLLQGKSYWGGSAGEIEKFLGLSGDEILYVGDHMFGDVHVTKNVLRWRTALILRELEDELMAIEGFRASEVELARLMDEKELIENELCQSRIQLQRAQSDYTAKPTVKKPEAKLASQKIEELRQRLRAVDHAITPLAIRSNELSNPIWGLLMRSGNNKSHLAFQVERYADIYTSRVSNLLLATPFAYLRSPRGSLPHDPSLPGGRPHSPKIEDPTE